MIKNKQLDLELEENYSEIIEKEIERLK